MKFYKVRRVDDPEVFAGAGMRTKRIKDGKVWANLKNVKLAISVAVGNGKAKFGEWEIIEYNARQSRVIPYTYNDVEIAE